MITKDKGSRARQILRSWHRYKFFVTKATTRGNITRSEKDGIIYWRERLFTDFITYLLPVCVIALVPGVYMGLMSGQYLLAAFYIGVVGSMAIVSLNVKLHLIFRKAFVLGMLYVLAIVLITELGATGPGNIYLFAISFIVTLMFPAAIAYWSVAANALICAGFALIIHFKLFPIPLCSEYNTGSYIGVSCNLMFLSLVTVRLLSCTIHGLEEVIVREFILKDELQKETASRIRSSQRLKDSDNHYRALFMQNPSPMWVLDNESQQFLQVNEAAMKNYGYTNKEFLSLTIKDIKLEKDMQSLTVDMQKGFETGLPVQLITRHRRKNQEQFYVEVIFNIIPYNGKNVSLVIAQDVTERMGHTREIESQNERLREIAHMQSHNVRGPLATIMGLTQLFTNGTPGITTEEIIRGIVSSADKLDAVIREIVNKTCEADISVFSGCAPLPV